ncbi:MAG: N-acetylmuramoyl-L-alanine amidase [Oscillospiraceae bacterium]|nr:N-acetylmuramoyl-L-alanine amidase [Oscillospiraceae bacterium]MBR2977211.1 N-acetylmuramoyl-L-alanine amidase [Oscillospiraceae bacterium]
MKILLIAGHGAGDAGAVSTINGVKYREAEETRVVVGLIADELRNRFNAEVGIYNTARDAFKDASAGFLSTAVKGYDYVCEVHFNAIRADHANGKTKGVEVYVTNAERSIGVELQICRKLAALGLTNRGVKRKDFDVIKTAKKVGVSAALVEVCFLDDPDDMAVYLKDKRAVARAIADGIAEGFGLSARPRTSREIVQQAAGLADSTMDYLAAYRWGNDLLDKLAAAIEKK